MGPFRRGGTLWGGLPKFARGLPKFGGCLILAGLGSGLGLGIGFGRIGKDKRGRVPGLCHVSMLMRHPQTHMLFLCTPDAMLTSAYGSQSRQSIKKTGSFFGFFCDFFLLKKPSCI